MAKDGLGGRIRSAREAAGYYSQAEFAKALGVSRGGIGQWESDNQRKTPGRDNLAKIAKLCGVTMDYLLGAEVAPQQIAPRDLPIAEIALDILWQLSPEALAYVKSNMP